MRLEEGTVVRWKGSGEKGMEENGDRGMGQGTGIRGEGMEGRVVEEKEGRGDGRAGEKG